MKNFITKLANVDREQPALMFAVAVTAAVTASLLFLSDGHALSAAAGRGAAVAVLTFAHFLAFRWVAGRVADKPKADSLTGDTA